MDKDKPKFAFGKKLGVAEIAYGNNRMLLDLIGRLLFCMQESNKINGVGCEFFRIDFRQPYFDETFQFPVGSFILDMKWGSKDELEEKKKPSTS